MPSAVREEMIAEDGTRARGPVSQPLTRFFFLSSFFIILSFSFFFSLKENRNNVKQKFLKMRRQDAQPISLRTYVYLKPFKVLS